MAEHASEDVDDEDANLREEDVQPVVGVSIGKEQTRLLSPTTPAAEKVAALNFNPGGDLFDGPADDSYERDLIECRGDAGPSTPPSVQDKDADSEPKLPSPWKASPKVHEDPDKSQKRYPSDLNDQRRASIGPTSMLAEMNVKRFMASFNFPSLPKAGSLVDFSLPSLPSFLNGPKDSDDHRKHTGRGKRPGSMFLPSFPWSNDDFVTRKQSPRFEQRHFSKDTHKSASSPQTDTLETPRADLQDIEIVPSNGRDVFPIEDRPAYLNAGQVPTVRRATSDQSLQLMRQLSNVTSLGDDTRWEHVQDQVNSRMKAIKDSFQDSSIKLPSLPSMPSLPNVSSLSLASLRPDFTKSRSASDPKRPLETIDALRNGAMPTVRGGYSSNVVDTKPKSPRYPPSYFEDALENLTGDIVIMGGYRGSILRSAKPPHRQLWVPVKVGLNIRKVNLEVGLNPEDEESMEDHIFSSGMLTHIGPVDMSRRLLKRLRACRNAHEGRLRIHDYGYDWRLSPHLLSRKLIRFLEGLPCNNGSKNAVERGATVIAHSLGGLITRHVVNQRPELFSGVLYAGVPQHCVNILGPIRNGDEVLLSSKVLTAQVNFTLRTSYLLLPEDGMCFIDKKTKEDYRVNFFDIEDWKNYAFSPCVATVQPAQGLPEKQGLLGSVTERLPSLPLHSKRASGLFSSSKDNFSEAVDAAATKAGDVVNADQRTVKPRMNPSPFTPAPTSPSMVCTIPLAAATAYLKRTLEETLAFKLQLAFNPDHAHKNAYPPLSVLYSTSAPTVYGARVSSREAINRADAYEDLAFASGDGVCLARAAMVPPGYKVCEGGRVRTERGHVTLLGDLEAVGKCLGIIKKARDQGVGLGASGRSM
ncbi:hypothetical protein MMC09_001932 [Bachmanniomyces sp. S44760]|nr:hypothetical protein [Bachmanniomyces sp. S44760]